MKTQEIFDQAQDKLNHVHTGISHFVDQAKPVAEDIVKKSKEIYKDTRERLPQGSEKYIGLVAAGVVVGFMAYQLGKKNQKATTMSHKVSEASAKVSEASADIKKNVLNPVATDFFTPAFKFAKLWMFYRLSL